MIASSHGAGASRVHRILVELASSYRSICIQIHALELAVVCVGHHLALGIRRLREELLLRGAGLVLGCLLHRSLVAHVAVDGRSGHWVDLLLLQEGRVAALATASAAHVGCLVKLIWEEPVRLADEVDVWLLGSSLPNRAVSPGSNAKATFIRSEVHLLLLRSLKQGSSRASTSSKVRLVPAVAHLLHGCRLGILSNHLLVCSLHVASRGLHLAHGHPLLALRRTTGIQNARLRPLLLILDGVVRLRCLHGRDGLLLHAALPDLVINNKLHLIRLNHLIRLVPLRWLLLQALGLYVRVLDHDLFVLLLDHLLVLH